MPLLHRRVHFRSEAQRVLEMIGAGDYDLDRPVGTLTIAQRQIVEIARMLARDAKLFILDEPTASLSDVEIERIFQALRKLKAQNCTIFYITHRLGEVFAICDTVTVLRNGHHVISGPVEDFDRARLVEHIVGRPLGELYPDRSPGPEAAAELRSPKPLGAGRSFEFFVPRRKRKNHLYCGTDRLRGAACPACARGTGSRRGRTGADQGRPASARISAAGARTRHRICLRRSSRRGHFLADARRR